ncbi:MAG: hypothetical protein R3C03_08050 [Pirellulaceae bacterium]
MSFILAGWLVLIMTILAQGQDVEERTVVGLVTAQKKYSVEVSTAEGFEDIQIPTTCPIFQTIERPDFQFANRMIRMELVASSMDGDPANNLFVELPLPDRIFVDGYFAHQNEFNRIWTDRRKQIVRYLLTRAEVSPSVPKNGDEHLRGEIVDGENNQVTVRCGDDRIELQLGDREAMMDGFSLADLRPLETVVEVVAHRIGGEWVAQSIRFRAVTDYSRMRDSGKYNWLVLGDESSFSMQRMLLNELGNRANIFHPPENCRSSANWTRAGAWLGDYRQDISRWDVVVFNAGLEDLSTTKADYQNNLRNWIKTLRQSGAQLVWLPTLSDGGENATEVELLNTWAEEVMNETEEVFSMTSLIENSDNANRMEIQKVVAEKMATQPWQK